MSAQFVFFDVCVCYLVSRCVSLLYFFNLVDRVKCKNHDHYVRWTFESPSDLLELSHFVMSFLLILSQISVLSGNSPNLIIWGQHGAGRSKKWHVVVWEPFPQSHSHWSCNPQAQAWGRAHLTPQRRKQQLHIQPAIFHLASNRKADAS